MQALLRRSLLYTYGALMPGHAAAWFERAFLTPRRAAVRAEEGARPQAGGRARRLPYGAGWLAVHEWGDPEAPAILLVHGWGDRASAFGAFVDPLVARGHRVVAFDLPAHGDSDGERTNLVECAGAALQVGASLGPLAGAVAHSFGGPVTGLAARHGLATGPIVTLGAPRSIMDLSMALGMRLGLPSRVVNRTATRLAQRLRFEWQELHTDALLVGLGAPLLVIHDHDDRAVPFSDARAIADGGGGCMHATSGLGHRGPLFDDAVIDRVLAFLESPQAPE